jgi:hypothetical protein
LNPNLELQDIDAISIDFKNLEIESKLEMPPGIFKMIGSLYKSAAERPEENDR